MREDGNEYESQDGGLTQNHDDSATDRTRNHDDTVPPSEYVSVKRLKKGALILGRYEVLSELGRGGMGVVCRCFDKIGRTEVAVKSLPPEVSHSEYDMEDVQDNYALVSSLIHQNIAAYKTLEADGDGDYFVVMEYVQGEELRRWVRRKRREGELTLERVLPVLRQVAEALDFAHRKKVVHRDIKPANIMLEADGTVKVLDFGLAAQIRTSFSHLSMAETGKSGTRQYMSPEQWRGQPQGASADQYALAAMAYEMLGGRVPFDNDDSAVLREIVLKEPPPALEDYSDAVNAVLTRGLAKDAKQRFASCMEFVTALEKADMSVSEKKETIVQPSSAEKVAVRSSSSMASPVAPSPQPPVQPVAVAAPPVASPPSRQPVRTVPVVAPPPPPQPVKKPSVSTPPVVPQPVITVERRENLTLNLADDVQLELVWIPAGTFMMGSPADELGRYSDETQHQVTLTKGFWIGKYPVTQAQYKVVVGTNPSYFKEKKQVTVKGNFIDRLFGNETKQVSQEVDVSLVLPVEQVSWDDAVSFCRKVMEFEKAARRLPTGYEYALPTEAQWEYACRAGTTKTLNSDMNLLNDNSEDSGLEELSWYDENSNGKTHPVGQKKPNAWGLYDMHGNVWEWCSDWYGNYPAGAVTDPKGPSGGSGRVIRGGSWSYLAARCRSAVRNGCDPLFRGNSLGFRLALVSVQ